MSDENRHEIEFFVKVKRQVRIPDISGSFITIKKNGAVSGHLSICRIKIGNPSDDGLFMSGLVDIHNVQYRFTSLANTAVLLPDPTLGDELIGLKGGSGDVSGIAVYSYLRPNLSGKSFSACFMAPGGDLDVAVVSSDSPVQFYIEEFRPDSAVIIARYKSKKDGAFRECRYTRNYIGMALRNLPNFTDVHDGDTGYILQGQQAVACIFPCV